MRIAGYQYNFQNDSFEIYVSGCKKNCEGCHNPELKSFEVGQEWNDEMKRQIIDVFTRMSPKLICIMGGEPLDQHDIDFELMLTSLCKLSTVIIFSGKDEINTNMVEYLHSFGVSYIKLGAYDKTRLCDDNIYMINGCELKLASSNQQIYTMNKKVGLEPMFKKYGISGKQA